MIDPLIAIDYTAIPLDLLIKFIMLSFRLQASQDDDTLVESLNYLSKYPFLGLDLTFFKYDQELDIPSALLVETLKTVDPYRLTMHMNHMSYLGENLVHHLNLNTLSTHKGLKHDLECAQQLNIIKGVLHWTNGWWSGQPNPEAMAQIFNMFHQHHVLPFLENIQCDFNYHQQLIGQAFKSNAPFGVCFDIGHAKIWGNTPFLTWFKWLEYLNQRGIQLMFHLHGNEGTHDIHAPIWDNKKCLEGGCLHPSMIYMIRELLERFPNATFVIENSTQYMKQNLEWFLTHFHSSLEKHIR